MVEGLDIGLGDLSFLSGDMSIVVSIVALCMFAFIGVLIVLYTLNQKYPKVQFRVIEQGMEKSITQRLMGIKVVPSNLIDILLKGDKMLGEDINTFDYLLTKGGKRIYYAYMRNAVLVPCRITETAIDVSEINRAREIAYRYVNVMKQTREQTAKNEPLIMAILTTLPLLLILAGFGFLIYILMTGVSDNILTIAELNKEVMEKAEQLFSCELSTPSALEETEITPSYNTSLNNIIGG
jgi:hypothetical protein